MKIEPGRHEAVRSMRTAALLSALLTLVLAFPDVLLAQPQGPATSSDSGIRRDLDGTPVVKGNRSTQAETKKYRKRAYRSLGVSRGSGGYVSPSLPGGSRASTITSPTVQPYKPPPITTYGDRVNSAIQSYPLNKGLGNNPTNMQMYIRQNSN